MHPTSATSRGGNVGLSPESAQRRLRSNGTSDTRRKRQILGNGGIREGLPVLCAVLYFYCTFNVAFSIFSSTSVFKFYYMATAIILNCKGIHTYAVW
ncbi:hypothetical protein SODALDRAFT_25865 [Sodiomyces alkalinus F11]|uniref:Uncharacterized protein n=1 Tax=Sodiomyces alkalinus (strain CBS 110278 / VKM F-3762 / F11) TaxID=1314773 RepID=A0A3N2Q7Y8_SODAK|nr:hypothetical protein SODALDRAFT_25865 [Sodiomyces alkalinus F11]ROT42883.1 hypothetical protein SODALDRAFT_25865 [Sodiomyces alkalinus F11]